MMQLTMTGRLGKDPVLTAAGNSNVCKFTIADTRTYKEKGERIDRPEWVTVEVWNKPGENAARFLKKGSWALVIGDFGTREYIDREGQKRFEVLCMNATVDFGPKVQGTSERSDSVGQMNIPPADQDQYTDPFGSRQSSSLDDIPF